jgi:hypothetical protein
MRCEVAQSEFSYQANLVRPILDTLESGTVYAGILDGLGRFGVRLSNIRVETSGPSPADQVLGCWVPAVDATVRFRLDRVEVTLVPHALDDQRMDDVVEAAVHVARNLGQPTADDKALDADVILAAQVATMDKGGDEAVVVTTNVGHLSRFVSAKLWSDV